MNLIWINKPIKRLTHTLVTGFRSGACDNWQMGDRPHRLVSLLGLGVRFGAPFFCLRPSNRIIEFVNRAIFWMLRLPGKPDGSVVLSAHQNRCGALFFDLSQNAARHGGYAPRLRPAWRLKGLSGAGEVGHQLVSFVLVR